MGRGKATTIVGIIAFLFLVVFVLALCFGAGMLTLALSEKGVTGVGWLQVWIGFSLQ